MLAVVVLLALLGCAFCGKPSVVACPADLASTLYDFANVGIRFELLKQTTCGYDSMEFAKCFVQAMIRAIFTDTMRIKSFDFRLQYEFNQERDLLVPFVSELKDLFAGLFDYKTDCQQIGVTHRCDIDFRFKTLEDKSLSVLNATILESIRGG